MIIDPMLATGSSLVAAIDVLKQVVVKISVLWFWLLHLKGLNVLKPHILMYVFYGIN
jgi:uracil phosphoribosyltransferase